MANRRFIDFPIASTVGDNDIVLIWQDGANKQTTKATILSGLPENLEDLNDVVISGLTNGQILRYDSVTGKWENTDQGNLDLNDLNDVSIVSPSNGQVLVYNSSTSKWENSSGGFVPYVGAVTTVDLGAQGLRAGYVRFDTSVASVPDEQGLMYWDASRSTAALIMNGTLQHIGQDTFFYVKNSSGSNIPKGTCVRFAGTDGASGHLLIAPFLANGSVPSSYFMGVTAEAIANGSFGQVMHFGELEGINTSGFTAGALLYASTTVAGGFQTTVPVAPNNIVLVAAAVNSKNNGAIIVRPQIGSNINNDEGVKITSPTTGDLLQLQAGGLWENKTLAQVIGSAYVPSTRTITINGTTQDLSANRTYNVGTVTSVGLSSATSGITIGSTPVTSSGTITLAIATASGSQNGLLSSTDWTTFNNKQNALTNPVTGTGASGQVAYFNGTTTITSESNLFWDATNDRLGIGTSSPTDRLTLHRDGATGVYAHWRNNSNANNAYIGITGSGLMQIQNNGNIDFYTGASYNNQMTLAGTGNLIIGNPGSDNGARLQVSGTAQATKLVSASNSFAGTLDFGTGAFKGIMDYTASTGLWSLNNQTAGASSTAYFQFQADSSPILTMLKSGNVGIGVTPSAWGSAYKALQIAQSSFAGATLYSWVGNNWVDDGSGNKYIANGFSTLYEQRSGEHRFLTATSGTAGNAISFTQAMTLTAAGRLLLGTTSDDGSRLRVNGTMALMPITSAPLWDTSTRIWMEDFFGSRYDGFQHRFDVGSSRTQALLINSTGAANFSNSLRIQGSTVPASGSGTELAYDGTNGYLLAFNRTSSVYLPLFVQGSSLSFGTGDGTTKMLITSSGNVGIGTSSPRTLLDVFANSDIWHTFIGGSTSKLLIGGQAGSGSVVLQAGNATTPNNAFPTTTYPLLLQRDGGNVLIGTTSDNGARLQVSGSATIVGPALPIAIASTNATELYCEYRYNTSTVVGYIGNGTGLMTGGGDANFGIRAQNSLVFSTLTNERMRISSTGNVGIGTSSPSTLIHLASTTNPYLRIQNTTTTNNGYFGSTTNGIEIGTDSATAPINFYTGSVYTERMRITSGGNVLIGTTTDIGEKLHVNGSGVFTSVVKAQFLSGENNDSSSPVIQGWNKATSGNNKFIEFYTEGGGGTLRGSIDFNRGAGLTRYNTTSDYRLKTELEDFNANSIIKNLKPKKYRMLNASEKMIGFIAHELQEFYPQAVSGKKDQVNESGLPIYQGIDYSQLTGLLVKAIQELKQEIDTLKN